MKVCGLCKKDNQLVESHLIPRAIYADQKKFYDSENRDLVIVEFDERKAFLTDKQFKQYALCKECESKFNKKGENFVLKDYFKKPNQFLLLDRLNKISEPLIIQNEKWYLPENIESLSPEKYLYFASSIFWRGSAIKWGGIVSDYYNALGKIYSEQFRKYLLGESGFPKNACLAVYVDNHKTFGRIVAFPTVNKMPDYHIHRFIIPGLKFVLLVGKGALIHDRIYKNGKIAFIKTPFNNSLANSEFSIIQKKLKKEVVAKGRLSKL